jgi:integrase
VLRVVGALVEIGGGKVLDETPKSWAGRRLASIPSEIIPDLRAHLDMFAEPEENGRVFAGPDGGPLKHSGFRRTWNKVRAAVELPDLHFHDLRHVGNTLAASNGASLKELMSRMEHSSTRAALIYQHARQDRDKASRRHWARRSRWHRRRPVARGWHGRTKSLLNDQRARSPDTG